MRLEHTRFAALVWFQPVPRTQISRRYEHDARCTTSARIGSTRSRVAHRQRPRRISYIREGSSTNFVVFYDGSLGANGKNLADALLASCEGEYSTLQGWFGGITLRPCRSTSTSIPARSAPTTPIAPQIHCAALSGTDPDIVRLVLAAEVDEVLMAAQAAGCTGASVVQSDFEAPGLPGHLEVVAVTGGGQMVHLWRDSGPAFAWNISTTIASGVRGKAALIQSKFGKKGNFEVVVPSATGGLLHFYRNNDDPTLP